MKSNYFLISALFLMLSTSMLFAQEASVSGTVTEKGSGNPLPGVNVILQGTTVGTTTDFDGNFSLRANDLEGKTIVFSYVSYKTVSIALSGSDQVLNVALEVDSNALDEVVIIGSSITQERKKLGNAITTIKGAKLVTTAPANVTTSLQGKIPGAQITQNSGDPAGGFSIRLRGPSTIKGSSEPLYVIDGVVASNLTVNVTNLNIVTRDAAPGQNRMADINPNDIESLNILNGAAAAAIYGSRASNGVVIITTKQGQSFEDGPELFFKQTVSTNSLRKKLDLNTDPKQFETIPNSPLSGRLWPIFGFDPQSLALTPHRNHSTNLESVTRYDYQDNIFQVGLGTDTYFSMRDGNENTSYMASIGYLDNEGIIRNTDFRRLSARLNVKQKIADIGTLDFGLYYSSSNSNEKPDGSVFWSPINAMNITNNVWDISQHDSNGNLYKVENTRVNPMSIIETFDITQSVNRIIPNVHLKLNPVKNLTIDQIIGLDKYSQKGHIYIPVYPYENVNPAYFNKGYLGDAEAQIFNWNYDINMVYDIDLSDRINSETTAGYSFQSSSLSFDGTQGRDLDGSGNPTVNLQTMPIDTNLDIFGYFVQESISIDDQLFLTAAGRVDGSTNFDVSKRNNFYPKISGSYVLSNGKNWKEDGLFNSFRLRASYGEAGNLTAISPYERFGSYTGVNFLGGEILHQNSRLGNEDLVPERTTELEYGADFSLFNNRLSMMVTSYKQKIEDLIVSRVLAPSSGGSTRTENVGSMENKGLEIYANIVAADTEDLKWNVNLNYSSNKNKVLKTTGGDIHVRSGGLATPIIVREGEPLGVFYGTYIARDSNGDPILTAANSNGSPVGGYQQERGNLSTGTPQRDSNGQPTGDILRKIIGDPNPDFILGFGTDLSYKDFTFNMQWESVQGFDIFDADKRTRQGVGLGRIARQELRGEIPRGFISSIYPIEEWRMEDGSFTKLRELSIGYNLHELLNGTLKNANISLIGRNLFSIDNFFSYDPETNSGGQSNLMRATNFGNVPIPRTISLSFSANF